jgi:hypothetical protein
MNKYKQLTNEQMTELFSRFLVDCWSYSSVTTFSRNEKEFERLYIYHEPSRSSVASIAGKAYHKALEEYFNAKRCCEPELSLATMEEAAYSYIDEVKSNEWKTSKTTPTIEECKTKALKDATTLLHNFYTERSIYTEDIAEVLGVEYRIEDWLTVNGVDIPLPCHMIIDLICRDKDGHIIIIDHKTKSKYTDEAEVKFAIGKQAITYVLGFETQFPDQKVSEVRFIENKISINKDGSPQLRCHSVMIDDNTRRLYEAILYEPLKRMIEATSDPDYVYVINDTDTMADKAETYDFWAKTMIAEIADFNIPQNKQDLIERRLLKIRNAGLATINPKTITQFRKEASTFIAYELREDMTNAEKIEHLLRTFAIPVRVAHELGKYSSITYLLEISAGTKISSIAKYKLDLANVLNVELVRIPDKLQVYQGKSYLSIEVPHKSTETLVWDDTRRDGLKLPIGVDNLDETIVWDMENNSTPHVLICGGTGSGKSVCIRSTIEYALKAGIYDIHIMDPKFEFCDYAGSENCQVFNEIEDIEQAMADLVRDMQSRTKSKDRHKTLIIFDEFADAVGQARSGVELDRKENVQVGEYKNGQPKYELRVVGRDKSLEENLKMLLQKGRSLGFRVLAATQRASTKVITGDAKANFPVQVCFRVPKSIDSMVVLDEEGAESLAGRGDGLIKSPEYVGLKRFQGFFLQ